MGRNEIVQMKVPIIHQASNAEKGIDEKKRDRCNESIYIRFFFSFFWGVGLNDLFDALTLSLSVQIPIPILADIQYT